MGCSQQEQFSAKCFASAHSETLRESWHALGTVSVSAKAKSSGLKKFLSRKYGERLVSAIKLSLGPYLLSGCT
jgi:hypothetical protein